MKKIFERNPILFFVIPLAIFFLLGCALLFLAIAKSDGMPAGAWLIIGSFILIPAILIYGLLFGFSISPKQQEAIEARKSEMQFNKAGMTILMPLFDQSCFIPWSSIDTILYTDFRNEAYSAYAIYVNAAPVYTKTAQTWWLNRLFPQHPKGKKINIKSDCRYFEHLPAMVENYLDVHLNFDFKDSRKGFLIYSETKVKEAIRTRVEKWAPMKEYEPVKVMYDKYNRNLNEWKADFVP